MVLLFIVIYIDKSCIVIEVNVVVLLICSTNLLLMNQSEFLNYY